MRPGALALAALLGACAAPRGTIGAVLSRDALGHVRVREVPERLAAARAGLAPDDRILLVDGRDVRSMTDADLHQALSGEAGSSVALTVERGDRVLRVTLARTPPPSPSARRPAGGR